MNNNRKCLKGHQHRWEEYLDYPLHQVKRCKRCKVLNWIHRRIDPPKVMPTRSADQIGYFM